MSYKSYKAINISQILLSEIETFFQDFSYKYEYHLDIFRVWTSD